jgi:hypothetical protein
MKSLKIKSNDQPAVTITRAAIQANKLVYIARANKGYRYPWGKSRIMYIGTTKVGANRIAASAATKAKDLLGRWGIRALEFHTVHSSKRQNVETWRELERALLVTFRETFGIVPLLNKQGRNMRRPKEGFPFQDEKLRAVLHRFS